MGDRCYCIFEGGGAKGIAHVGALAALEESGLELAGFAGTSAGALIAALAAVGYTSSELVSANHTILDDVDLDRTNIWSGAPHRPAHAPNRLFGRLGWLAIRIARRARVVPVIGILLILLLAGPVLAWTRILSPGSAIILHLVALLLMAGGLIWLAHGLASLSEMERALNQLLKLGLARVGKLEARHRARDPAPVTFAHLASAGFPPLKIIAADISSRGMAIFSNATTPGASVAAAVAASACLPVIFKPRIIEKRLHLDGGLVSNLPAWAFDAERAIDRDAWTAVIEVSDPPRSQARPRGPAILRETIMTGIFGSGVLNIRNVERLEAVRLRVTLSLLQFDPGRSVAMTVIEEARRTCRKQLVYALCDLPALMTDICKQLIGRTLQLITRATRTQGTNFTGLLRVAFLKPVADDPASLLYNFGVGHADHPDERIRLPRDSSFAGEALRSGVPLYIDRHDPAWSQYLMRPEDRWTRKMIWPEMKWSLCIPYFHAPSDTHLVVALDSNAYIPMSSVSLAVTLKAVADMVETALTELLPEEVFRHGRNDDR